MIYKVFSVYDKAVEAYLPPLYLRSRGEATRMVTQSLQTPEHQFAKHSADYSLFELGSWDDSTSIFTPNDVPFLLGTVSDFKQQD